MNFDRCAQKRVLVRTDYHRADMVKWLSSEVSNLMSWVRLPLSAPWRGVHFLQVADTPQVQGFGGRCCRLGMPCGGGGVEDIGGAVRRRSTNAMARASRSSSQRVRRRRPCTNKPSRRTINSTWPRATCPRSSSTHHDMSVHSIRVGSSTSNKRLSTTFTFSVTSSMATLPPGSLTVMTKSMGTMRATSVWNHRVALSASGAMTTVCERAPPNRSEPPSHVTRAVTGTSMLWVTVHVKANFGPTAKSTSGSTSWHSRVASATFREASCGQWSGDSAPMLLLSPYPSPSLSTCCVERSGKASSSSAKPSSSLSSQPRALECVEVPATDGQSSETDVPP